MNRTDAAEIAAGISVGTVDGHNLRTLLLRDGAPVPKHLWMSEARAAAHAVALGLAENDEEEASGVSLTPLGREVTERLRPKPWRVEDHVAGWFAVVHGSANGTIICESREDATTIAVLLSANDDWKAKQYRSAP